MILDFIRNVKKKMVEQGLKPNFLFCSSETRRNIGLLVKRIMENETLDPDHLTVVEGLNVEIVEDIPFMRVFIIEENFNAEVAIEQDKIMSSVERTPRTTLH